MKREHLMTMCWLLEMLLVSTHVTLNFNFVELILLLTGFVDPMTGEGIHTAMESGKTAASVLEDALTVGNFDAAVLEEYQNRWLNSFGTDFYWLVRRWVF